MKREIKFRAKDHIHNQWLYGNLAKDRKGYNVILPTEDWSKGGTVYEETIGQFTGLYDRNQKAIYEGDIVQSVEYNDVKHIVVYDEHYASFMALHIDGNMGTPLESKCHFTQNWIDDYPKEVIGNIHDNKDLLEE